MIQRFEEVLNKTRHFIQNISGVHGILNTGAAQALLDVLDQAEIPDKSHLKPITALNCLQSLSKLQSLIDEDDYHNSSNYHIKVSPLARECNSIRVDLRDTIINYIENDLGDYE